MPLNIDFEISPIEEALEAIKDSIVENLSNSQKGDPAPLSVENEIAHLIDELDDSLFCLIEFPYVDKVYRDSYYNYYASKHLNYKRDCIRVSLFQQEIIPLDFLDASRHGFLRDNFLGYFVVRPTLKAPIGRSFIHPKAFSLTNIGICSGFSTCMIYGVKFQVEGFPHSSQDAETILCAETTIWAIMEYFGYKYPEYRPTLPSSIHKALETVSFQRQLPSKGLTMDQISYALRSFGFGTEIYSAKVYEHEEITELIDYYIESGIPVLIGLQYEDMGHVVIGIGKENHEEVMPKDQGWKVFSEENQIKYFETAGLLTRYVIQDDNLTPYKKVQLGFPGEHYEDNDCRFYQIDSIVVPLYPKIYLEAYVAKDLTIQIIKDESLGYRFMENFAFRFFLTSSRSFKQHISALPNLNNKIKSNILLTKTPKFIWVAEFYSPDVYASDDKIALAIMLLDATEANQESSDALIFAGYPDKCIGLNDNNFVVLPLGLSNYRYYSNLKHH